MRLFKIAFTFSFFAFFCGVSQASYEPWPIVETEKAKYISEPSNRMESVRYIEPYDKNFLPYEICGEPSDFKITNLSMKLQYRFVNRNELNYPWYYAFGIRYQYDCQFHVVKVDYEVS